MNINFYDIESLDNVFTLCNFKRKENIIEVFYLSDDPSIVSSLTLKQDLLTIIYDKNKNFNGDIVLYDLHYQTSCEHLAKTFGLSDAYMANDPNSMSNYPVDFRLVCDTDPDYDEAKHPYLMGYNSYNYDTTMLTIFLHAVFWCLSKWDNRRGGNGIQKQTEFHPTTAKFMRKANDELFSPRFKSCMPTFLTQEFDIKTGMYGVTNYSDPRWKIRKNMLFSGRHIDVAKLNEKQSKVALKRLLGMLGFQILESDKLSNDAHINNAEEFYELIAYNCSDCINLGKLFDHKQYKSGFNLKKGLLKKYPELVYEKLPNEYKPDIRPNKVRRDRLTIDSSSAQFSTKSLCPYGHLTDIPAVSFLYPSEKKAKELGIPQVNVLEEAKKFFYANFKNPEVRAEFDKIYDYYKSIEGKNFNTSENYISDYTGVLPNPRQSWSTSCLPDINTNMFYYDANEKPTSCYITFSIGGIHGAEYNKALYEADMETWQQDSNDILYAIKLYPNPTDCKKAKVVMMPDGREIRATKLLKSGSTMKAAYYKDLSAKKPQLFQKKSGSYKLNPKYTFTSADPTNHEDFTSYYPNMLIMMSAFWNDGLGYDRYNEIFNEKETFGKLQNDESLSAEEREYYAISRDGTKLILNSATGAADAGFESNIIMNNRIISMRIIGQLFTWRIGQAQALKGARITSTNTDGLFTVMEENMNNAILAKEAQDIGVAIEPELTYLISKDSNNRLEMNPETGKVDNSSGGTLGCSKGPNPTKSLNHPAIIDWALCEYLIVASLGHKDLALSKEFDDEVGMNILKSAKNKFEPVRWLNMFQNVVASSIGSMSYIFGTSDADPDNPIILQHYNRVFIMNETMSRTIHLRAAAARAVTDAMNKTRRRQNEKLIQNDLTAIEVLNGNGIKISDIPAGKEACVKKITNVEPEWHMLVENHSLYELTDVETSEIMDNINYEGYLKLLHDCYEKNWRNIVPAQKAA